MGACASPTGERGSCGGPWYGSSREEVEPLAEPGRLSLGLRLEPGQERAVRVSVIIEEGGQEEIRWRDRAALR
jgi:hypothetical protein